MKNKKKFIYTIASISLLLFILGCSSAPRYHSREIPESQKVSVTKKKKEAPTLIQGSKHTTVFTASYYGPNFHGKLASNGQVFDMHKMTAAHKSLPFGTVLKITYPVTNKSVNVTIIDRGPFVEGRDIDLSFGAAQKIGLVKNGVGKVNVTVVQWGDGRTYHHNNKE